MIQRTRRAFLTASLFTAVLSLACASRSDGPKAAITGGKPPEFPGGYAWGGGGGTMLRDDGTLERFTLADEKDGKKVVVHTSSDNGKTWSEPKDVGLSLKGTDWGGPGGLRDRNGELQFFFIRERRIGDGKQGAVTRFLNMWHIHSTDGVTKWSEPKMIFEGYTGNMSNPIQLTSGRIIMPIGSLIPHRKPAPPTGRHETWVYYSDDDGKTFQQSSARLVAPAYDNYNGSNEGACEPAVVQLKDGRVLMEMRNSSGFLYESISQDGVNWPAAWASRFHTSTGPPSLVRLKDDRIMLVWNNCEMPQRVEGRILYGGRDVLHAVIANPDLTAWRGWREIYRDPTRSKSPATKGDRGTAYPDTLQLADGRVAVSSGQGGVRALMYVDPAWLYETHQSSDFSNGLDDWTVFKGIGEVTGYWRAREQGAELIDHPDKPGKKTLHLRKPDDNAPDGAVWNFPMGTFGKMVMRIRLNPESSGASIALCDRFFEPCDDWAEREAVFVLPVGLKTEGPIVGVSPAQWHELVLNWDTTKGLCRVSVDGRDVAPLQMLNRTLNGICYLHLRSRAIKPEQSGWLIESVSVDVRPESPDGPAVERYVRN